MKTQLTGEAYRLGAAPARPVLTPATVTHVGDRSGLARLDSGSVVEVRLPDVLWLRAKDRVMLYRYPHGWVAVLRVRFAPSLSFAEGKERRVR